MHKGWHLVLSKELECATTKRLGATFVDLHTALMGPGVNLRAALRLIASIEQLLCASLGIIGGCFRNMSAIICTVHHPRRRYKDDAFDLSDGLHLGRQGAAVLLSLLAPVIHKKLGTSPESPLQMPLWRDLDNTDVAKSYKKWQTT